MREVCVIKSRREGVCGPNKGEECVIIRLGGEDCETLLVGRSV